MRGKEDAERAPELPGHLDKNTIANFSEKFTNNGAISDSGRILKVVRNAFLENFSENAEPQAAIRKAEMACLTRRDLMAFRSILDSLNNQASFYDEACFGFLRIVVTKIPELNTFATYRGAGCYTERKRAIADIDGSFKAIFSPL